VLVFVNRGRRNVENGDVLVGEIVGDKSHSLHFEVHRRFAAFP
jgi:hypothetical protein